MIDLEFCMLTCGSLQEAQFTGETHKYQMPLCFANNWAIPAASSGEETDLEHCKVEQRAALDLEHSLGRSQRFLGVQQGCYGIPPSTVVVWCTYYTYFDSPLSAK